MTVENAGGNFMTALNSRTKRQIKPRSAQNTPRARPARPEASRPSEMGGHEGITQAKTGHLWQNASDNRRQTCLLSSSARRWYGGPTADGADAEACSAPAAAALERGGGWGGRPPTGPTPKRARRPRRWPRGGGGVGVALAGSLSQRCRQMQIVLQIQLEVSRNKNS